MQRGRLLLIIGGVILLITIAVGGFLWWSGGLSSSPPPSETVATPEPVRTADVVVAAQTIPRGMLITEDSNAVTVRSWLADTAPETGVGEPSAVYGRVARVEIVRGSPILEGMLTDEAGDLADTGSDAALQIPEGRVAYAMPVSRYSSVAWALEPGDHVDLLISLTLVELDEEFQTILPNQFTCASGAEECQPGILGRIEALPNGWVVNTIPSEGQRPGLVTQLTVQDGLVLRVGDWEEPAPPPPTEGAEGEAPTPTPVPQVRALTLAVTPQDALVLKYAQEVGASMSLVLRSVGDESQQVDTESVTLEYLLERFNIEQPPKLPYGVEPPVLRVAPSTAGGGTSSE